MHFCSWKRKKIKMVFLQHPAPLWPSRYDRLYETPSSENVPAIHDCCGRAPSQAQNIDWYTVYPHIHIEYWTKVAKFYLLVILLARPYFFYIAKRANLVRTLLYIVVRGIFGDWLRKGALQIENIAGITNILVRSRVNWRWLEMINSSIS